jgi:anion-transporting  ArsA/GET3 family ATPase
MRGLLDRSLLVVTGKGGVGKTTVAAALGLLAANSGRQTIVVEVGEQSRLAGLFGRRSAEPGSPTELRERLSSISIDPDRALLEWLQALGGRISGRVLASSGTFQYFAAAAPGAKELVSMVKIAQLTRAPRRARGARPLVILDAPATGHALGMLRSPATFGAIARVGPIVRQTAQLQELLRDDARSAYLGVALGTEMAVTETLELQEGLRDALQRDLAAVVVNGLLPRRFSATEMARVEGLGQAGDGASHEVLAAAARAAREVHTRAGFQHAQLARLRRRGLPVVGLPFHFGAELDLEAVQELAERLAQGLARSEDRGRRSDAG